MTKEAQIKGSLYGLLWGDVLGCPVETWQQRDIETVYGAYETLPTQYPMSKIKQVDPRRTKRLRPLGLYSDDGQQALALLHTCLQPNGWHTMNWRNLLVNGLEKHAWRGIGGFFTRAVQKMQRGVRTEHAGSHSAGIGAAMRIGPIGALYADDPDMLVKVALESSLITHADIRAATFSYVVAYTVAAFIRGEELNAITTQLGNEAKKAEDTILTVYKNWSIDTTGKHQVSDSIRILFAQPITDINETRTHITQVAKPHLAEGFTKAHPNQGFVLTGGLHALAVALQASVSSPEEALCSIVRLGYDTDTVAAIAGTMLGARFGDSWVDKTRLIDYERIEQYAQALVNRTTPPENTKTFLANEVQLTEQEKAFQRNLK